VTETRPTLLVVEDDLDVAEMLAAYFQVQGYQVSTVDYMAWNLGQMIL
jgi:DNA-binding response OmpR family regulator